MSQHKPCNGTARADEFRKLREEHLKPGLSTMEMEPILMMIDHEISERHKRRIFNAPRPDGVGGPDRHPFHCGCHWCCHDEEFDDDIANCPACQEEIYVLRATADWSGSSLVSDNATGITDTIKHDLDAMLEHPEDGGEVTIRLEKRKYYEWQEFLLMGREFEGFD